MNDIKIIDSKKCAALLGVSTQSLSRYRNNKSAGVDIPFIKIGRNVRYIADDLYLWLINRY
jgi:hypothetical protein